MQANRLTNHQKIVRLVVCAMLTALGVVLGGLLSTPAMPFGSYTLKIGSACAGYNRRRALRTGIRGDSRRAVRSASGAHFPQGRIYAVVHGCGRSVWASTRAVLH